MARKLIARFRVLFDKIVSGVFSDFFWRQKLDEALLEKLKKNMIIIDTVLPVDNYELVHVTVWDCWIRCLNVLNCIIHELEDLLPDVDKLEAKFKIITTLIRVWSYCYNLTFRIFFKKHRPLITSLEKGIEDRMKEIIKEMEYLAMIIGTQDSMKREPYQLSATADSFEDEIEVFGRDEDKEAVLKLLLSPNASDNQIGLITILGEGGVGKSTLAQLVYNDDLVEEYFDIKEWIYISENFDPAWWYQSFQSKFKGGLLMKKFLIIIDDVLYGQNFIRRFLQEPIPWQKGCKIIVTTRFQSVASMGSLPPYHLKPITHEDSWRLFAKHAFADENSCSYGRREAIGKKIVKNECYGLPLAAKVLGAVLRFKPTVEDWNAIFKKNNISDDLIDTTTGLPPALVWSYYYLPAHLKQCFAFCAILPRSYEFEENQIIRYWKALGLLQQPYDHKTMEQIGHETFHGLTSRSFFQQTRGNKSRFVMHDVLHDLALNISRRVNENFELSDCPSLETRFPRLPSEDFLWLHDGNRMLLRRFDKPMYRPPGLSDSNVVRLKIDDEMVSELSSTDVSITSLSFPPETSKISNEDSSIKHEGASEIPLKMTESSSDTDDPINIWYSQISSLESLKVSEISQLIKLPPRLHSLKIEGCDALKSLPEELMLNSIHLQQLYIIDCCFLESFSVDHLPTTLKSLYIRNCKKLKFPSPLETKQHALLEHLCIGSSCDSLSSFHLSLFPELRSLAIWDCVNFRSFSTSKNHMSLDALEIRDCPKLLSFLEEGLHTPNLTSIFLSNCKNLKGITKPMDKLISLRSFFINGCPELSSIINGCFPENLSSLCITYCHKLTPSIQWKMNELNNLSCFEIEGGCIDLKTFPEQNLLPSSLNSLRISRLSNLEFLDYKGLERLTSLETLKINGCDKLQSFPEEGLPSSVTYLYINECSLLKAKFQDRRGKEWYKIAHVPHIQIDEEVIS